MIPIQNAILFNNIYPQWHQNSKCEKWNTGNTSSHVLTAVFLWLFATMIIMMIICGAQFVTRQLFSDHCAKPPRNPYFRKTEFLTWKNPQWKTLPLRKHTRTKREGFENCCNDQGGVHRLLLYFLWESSTSYDFVLSL